MKATANATATKMSNIIVLTPEGTVIIGHEHMETIVPMQVFATWAEYVNYVDKLVNYVDSHLLFIEGTYETRLGIDFNPKLRKELAEILGNE